MKEEFRLMKRLFIKFAQKFLHRPDLNFSEEIPMSYYLYISKQRFGMLIRGKIRGFIWKKHGKRLFIGKHTKILCSKYIEAGNGLSIQDNVQINALSKEGVHFGDNCSIGESTTIKVSGSLTKIGLGFWMGDYSAMGNDCFVGAAGGIRIGDYVAIGQNVRFHSENHEFHDKNKRISEQGVTNKGIVIGNDVWIGAGAVFLDGVHVGDGCVVGANTLVNRDIPDYSIAVGNPVKIVGKR